MPYRRKRKPRLLILFGILMLVYLCFASLANSNSVLRYRYPLKYSDLIFNYSFENNLDPMLVATVIYVESRFDPKALSAKGARGLMQIMPETGKWAAGKLGIDDFKEDMLYEPELNIKLGSWYLSTLMTEYAGNMNLVMAAYNGGRGNVNQWIKANTISSSGQDIENIPFSETRLYIKKINSIYQIYKKIY